MIGWLFRDYTVEIKQRQLLSCVVVVETVNKIKLAKMGGLVY